MEVVPLCFKEDYLSANNDRRYFDAIGYILPISKKQFQRLNFEGKVIFEQGQAFVDAAYDASCGLILKV